MVWVKFRTKNGLRKLKLSLEKNISDIVSDIKRLKIEENRIWSDVKSKTKKAGLGDDTDTYIRQNQRYGVAEVTELLEKRVKLERQKDELEEILNGVQKELDAREKK